MSTATAERVSVLGTEIDVLDMAETVERCDELIRSGGYAQHLAINVAKVIKLREDTELREIAEGCALVNADGQGVVWASRLLGTPLPERVAGIDLMMELLGLAERKGYRVYVLGAKADVLQQAVAKLRERYPRLVFAGYRDGYFAGHEAEVAAEIREANADIIFVAMSTPGKERFLAKWGPELDVPFAMGVGGSIDVVAGITKRAPVIWQRLGAEWLYRLLQEPRRMFRRYAETNAQFAWLLARELVRRRRAAA